MHPRELKIGTRAGRRQTRGHRTKARSKVKLKASRITVKGRAERAHTRACWTGVRRRDVEDTRSLHVHGRPSKTKSNVYDVIDVRGGAAHEAPGCYGRLHVEYRSG